MRKEMRPDLSVKIGSLKLHNPVMVASGTFGYAEEFRDYFDLRTLGALVTKTITVDPRQGNPPPRTCETPSGMLNSIGLENPGLEAFIREKLPKAASFGVPVIVSVAAEHDADEFSVLLERLSPLASVAAFELNISCPNVSHGRPALIAQDAKATAAVVRRARRATDKPLIAKLSPNVTDIVEIASAAYDSGCDGLALINTLTGMSIEVRTRRPKISRIVAGLSGPAIRPVAVRMVWEVARKIPVPIIGMGGIIDTFSALEFFLAGATAVAVGTAHFVNPAAAPEIVRGLSQYLKEHRFGSIRDIIGTVA